MIEIKTKIPSTLSEMLTNVYQNVAPTDRMPTSNQLKVAGLAYEMRSILEPFLLFLSDLIVNGIVNADNVNACFGESFITMEGKRREENEQTNRCGRI